MARRVIVSFVLPFSRSKLNRNRVLDSGRIFGSAYGQRLCIYVDDYTVQHRNLRATFPQLQGIYHDRWVAYASTA